MAASSRIGMATRSFAQESGRAVGRKRRERIEERE
jgi:hypothetical protein